MALRGKFFTLSLWRDQSAIDHLGRGASTAARGPRQARPPALVRACHHVPVTVLFDDDIHVHYGFIFLSTQDDSPDLMEPRRGQQNGLCGAAVAGVLSLITGLHTGRVRLRVEWLDTEPSLDP